LLLHKCMVFAVSIEASRWLICVSVKTQY